jgi:hypothetical protein
MNSWGAMGATMPNETRRSACGKGRLRNKMRSNTLKTAVPAPAPRAIAKTAARVNMGVRRRERAAWRKSCAKISRWWFTGMPGLLWRPNPV